MEENYEVFFEGQPVGKVQMLRQGLYYRFCCRCRIQNGRVCRLVVQWEDGWENLGIPVPEGNGFELTKKLPAKRLGKGSLRFLMIPSDRDIQQELYPEIHEPELPQIPEAAEERPEPIQQLPEQPVEEEAPESTDPEEEPQQEEPQQEEPEREESLAEFVPILPELPFERLDELGSAVFTVQDGQAGALIPQEDQISSESPTGQWSEPSTSE